MSISPTSSTTAASGATQADTAQRGFLGKDDFLKLLVEQLKQQDPTSPTDMNGMTQQMTQFGILEQITNLASASKESTTSLKETHAIALLGRTVSYLDASGATQTGLVEHVDTSGDSPLLTVAGKDGIDPEALTSVG